MIWAILLGYSIGSLPSADAIGRLGGHDLRNSGSGNPGTANTLRVAGPMSAAVVLGVDIAKGAIAVMAGISIAGTGGGIAGGVAAIAGQVHNPWFRFKGGKGLGVTAGVTVVAWPPGLLVALAVTAIGAKFLRATGGAIAGLTAYSVGSVLWAANNWDTWWGVPTDDRLVWLAIGVVGLTAPKFIVDQMNRPDPGPT